LSSKHSEKSSEGEIIKRIEEHKRKILEAHELNREKALVIRELRFPHGRADIIIYGLLEDLYVVPIGVEVKTSIKSGTELYYYINQIRETYEYAFPIIYLATKKLADDKRKTMHSYLNEIGYGLIEITQEDIEILKAKPKKTPKSEYDYCEVVSKGLLYLATAEILEEKGFRDVMKVTSTWIGTNTSISFCSFTRGNYAVFGVYARGLDNVKKLLDFLLSKESLVEKLSKIGYKVYIESCLVMRGILGYVRHIDESLSMDTVKAISNIIEKRRKLTLAKGWGLGLGVYRPLWEHFFMPTYSTALRAIEKAIEELVDFYDLIKPLPTQT